MQTLLKNLVDFVDYLTLKGLNQPTIQVKAETDINDELTKVLSSKAQRFWWWSGHICLELLLLSSETAQTLAGCGEDQGQCSHRPQIVVFRKISSA